MLGLFTLVAGLALLVYAWVVFWRASHGWQRLWFIPVVLVALLTMFSVGQGVMLAYAPRLPRAPTNRITRGMCPDVSTA